MTMPDHRGNELSERVRETYHVPPETPREEMWRSISTQLAEADTPVIDLTEERRRRSLARHPASWAVAAAALLVLGVGIGRSSTPIVEGPAAMATPTTVPDRAAALRFAARGHLGETESLLTVVRADARSGSLDQATGAWARELLSQTRLLMDARQPGDVAVDDLFEDLELILIQIIGVAETGSMNEARARLELELAIRALEHGEVLARIQAMLPMGMAGA